MRNHSIDQRQSCNGTFKPVNLSRDNSGWPRGWHPPRKTLSSRAMALTLKARQTSTRRQDQESQAENPTQLAEVLDVDGGGRLNACEIPQS